MDCETGHRAEATHTLKLTDGSTRLVCFDCWSKFRRRRRRRRTELREKATRDERERCLALFELFRTDITRRISWDTMSDAIRDGLTVEQLESRLRENAR